MNKTWREGIQTFIAVVGPVILVGPIVYVASLLVGGGTAEYWLFVKYNYLVFFGMPYAAFFAYYLVVTLESSRGPIEVEFFQLKFRGAAGPLVFWLLIFLAVLLGFKLFWQGVPPSP